PTGWRRSDSAEGDGHVVPTETERVVDRDVDAAGARGTCHDVQVDLRILLFQVERRGDDLLVDRHHRQHRLQGAGGADGVAQRALGRVDAGVVADRGVDRQG